MGLKVECLAHGQESGFRSVEPGGVFLQGNRFCGQRLPFLMWLRAGSTIPSSGAWPDSCPVFPGTPRDGTARAELTPPVFRAFDWSQ